MKQIKFFTALWIFTILLFTLCACQTDIGKTARSAVDDTAIATKVIGKFYKDPVINMFDIMVKSEHGVVTLEGKVDSETARGRAERVALTVNGVRKVNNLITVR